jgi:hypothetical protein
MLWCHRRILLQRRRIQRRALHHHLVAGAQIQVCQRRTVAADEFAGIARIRIVKVRRSNPVRATSPADLDRGFVCELPIGGLLSVLCWFDFWWCVWTLAQADMRFKDKFFACLSLGERTYRTERSDKFSNTHLFFSSSSLPQTSLLN